MDDALGGQTRLTTALVQAQARFEQTAPQLRIHDPAQGLPELGRVVVRAIGGMGSSYDFEFFENLTILEPFGPLSPALQVIQWNVEGVRAVMQSRHHAACEHNERILSRMAEPDRAQLDPMSARWMGLGLKFALELVAADYGAPLNEARMSELESEPLFAVSFQHLRRVAALSVGDTAQADAHQRKADVMRLQDSPPQMFGGSLLL